jgi:hypothetical protein
MALKPDRSVYQDDISYFSRTVMERGGVVCQEPQTLTTSNVPGSGAAMDTSAQKVAYASGISDISGKIPVGLLLNDVVSIDQSRQILNTYKSEMQVGDKVTLLKKGVVVTNMITSNSATGTVPVAAYLYSSGLLTDKAGYAASGCPLVGTFLSRADADGYAKVQINL